MWFSGNNIIFSAKASPFQSDSLLKSTIYLVQSSTTEDMAQVRDCNKDCSNYAMLLIWKTSSFSLSD